MKKILIFIGARGGSKGVKGKNIRSLLGAPLICYTIKQALEWGKAARVVVSTDSLIIADIAKKAGAEVPFLRPKKLASDTAMKGSAIRHCVKKCEKIFKETYGIIVDLDVTAPIRTVEDIENCWKIFLKDKPLTLFSVVHPHKNPYFNMVEKQSNGNYELCKKPKKYIYRRQNSPEVYSMNASIYFYDRNYMLNTNPPSPFSRKTRVYCMNDLAGIDIDREIDFKYVEFLVKEGIVKL